MKFSLLIPLCLFLLCSSRKNDNLSRLPDNFHQVDSVFFRSGQPLGKEYSAIKQRGICTIINLRKSKMSQKSQQEGLNYIHIPLETDEVTAEDILSVLLSIRDAPKPILIHCRRGSDRTGCMVAAYRIVFNGWDKQRALTEMLDPKYAYLENLFPKLKQLILNCDEQALREQILN